MSCSNRGNITKRYVGLQLLKTGPKAKPTKAYPIMSDLCENLCRSPSDFRANPKRILIISHSFGKVIISPKPARTITVSIVKFSERSPVESTASLRINVSKNIEVASDRITISGFFQLL